MSITSNFNSICKDISEIPLTKKHLVLKEALDCNNLTAKWIVKEIRRIVVWLKGKGWINNKKILQIINRQHQNLDQFVVQMRQNSNRIAEIMAQAHYINPKPALTHEEEAALQRIRKLAETFIKLSTLEGQVAPTSQFFKDLQEIDQFSKKIQVILQEPSSSDSKPSSKKSSKHPEPIPIKPKGNPLIEKFSAESKEKLARFMIALSQLLQGEIGDAEEEYRIIGKISAEELLPENGYCCDPFKFLKGNRYTNNLPWLYNCFGDENGDGYVNASKIYVGNTHFIAGQAPIPKRDGDPGTVKDFLKLVCSENCSVIVTLVMPLEASLKGLTEKSAHYWKRTKKGLDLGDGYRINQTSKEKIATSTTSTQKLLRRILTVTKDGEFVKEITQLHYKNLPDHGTGEMEIFSELIRNCMEYEQGNPILTHCSAGLGRTGIFIAAYSFIKEIEAKRKEGMSDDTVILNFVERVMAMRAQRGGMLANSAQYEMVKNIVINWFKSKEEKKEEEAK